MDLPQYSIENLPDAEQLVICPYNEAHKVIKHRMPKHLIKCRKSHSTAGTKVCRFNAVHVLPLAEIQHHEDTCPDRILVEKFMGTCANFKREAELDLISNSSVGAISDWDHLDHPTNIPQ